MIKHCRPEDRKWAAKPKQDDIFDYLYFKRFQPRQKSIVIDGGAHVGVVTLHMNDFLHNIDTPIEIHAFEPQSENYDFLVKNTEGLNNIVTHKTGLGAANEKLSLHVHSECSARCSIVPDPSYPKESEVEVIDVIDTNEFILSLEHEVFIFKFDLEGYETKVINENLTPAALSRIKVLVIESHYGDPVNWQKLIDNGFVFHGCPTLHGCHAQGYHLQHRLYVRNEPFKERMWEQVSFR